LRFKVRGLSVRIWGFKNWGLGFGAWGLEFGIWHLGFWRK